MLIDNLHVNLQVEEELHQVKVIHAHLIQIQEVLIQEVVVDAQVLAVLVQYAQILTQIDLLILLLQVLVVVQVHIIQDLLQVKEVLAHIIQEAHLHVVQVLHIQEVHQAREAHQVALQVVQEVEALLAQDLVVLALEEEDKQIKLLFYEKVFNHNN
jgi:hypothetical protein